MQAFVEGPGKILSLVEPAGRPAPFRRQSACVPDLAARCAAPVRGSVHVLTGGLDLNRSAEGAGVGRDGCLSGLGIHRARLSALGIERRSKFVPYMPAHRTEGALRVRALERNEGVWRGAPGAADVASGRHLRKQDHASSLGNARVAHCPGVHTSASEAMHPT
jgi:hypothetical protein